MRSELRTKGNDWMALAPGKLLRIGSNPRCDVVLEGDSFVSGHHANLEHRPPMTRLFEHSANGSTVDGKSVHHKTRLLSQNSQIGFGKSLLEFRTLPGDAPPPSDLPRSGRYKCESCTRMVRRRTPKIERYEFLEFLGAGRAGEVYLALDRETKALVAIKFYVLKNPDEEQLKKDVVRFLKGLQAHSELGEHPFVIGYRDSGYIPGAGIYLVTDLVDGCDFHSLVVEQGPLEWPVAKELFEEILEGLHFLHENQTAHRDIKPSNIMAEPKEGKWTAKIADFDLTHNFFKAGLDSYTSTKTAFYSEGFSPPEQIMQFQKLDPSADIYAIGMTFYFILMGNLPLAEMGDKPAFPELEAQFPVRSPIRDPLKKKNLPTAAIDALERCLRRNPADRFANAGELKKALFGG